MIGLDLSSPIANDPRLYYRNNNFKIAPFLIDEAFGHANAIIGGLGVYDRYFYYVLLHFDVCDLLTASQRPAIYMAPSALS